MTKTQKKMTKRQKKSYQNEKKQTFFSQFQTTILKILNVKNSWKQENFLIFVCFGNCVQNVGHLLESKNLHI